LSKNNLQEELAERGSHNYARLMGPWVDLRHLGRAVGNTTHLAARASFLRLWKSLEIPSTCVHSVPHVELKANVTPQGRKKEKRFAVGVHYWT